jgi:predicted tellurium resistance membrane protein TerC
MTDPMVFVIRVNFGQLSGIFFGLVLLGIGYNLLTAWLERHGYMDGITSLVVALGVALTITPFAVISLPVALMIAGGFVASGLPMMIGSISRYIKQRDQARKLLAERYERYGINAERVAK